MSKLKLKLEVTATDTRKYKSVIFGIYEAEFDIDDFLGTDRFVWKQYINKEAGITKDSRLAFLQGIQVQPKVIFGQPPEKDVYLD